MALRVDTVDDIHALESLAGEWNRVLQRSGSNHPFLTWEWVSTWWSVYRRNATLCVLTARDDDGRLVGIAPLKLQRRRLLGIWPSTFVEFIGYGGDVTPEYLDFIVDDAHRDAVIGAFARELLRRRVDGLDLRPFSGESPNLHPFRRCLEQAGHTVSVEPSSICPILRLPASDEAFLAARSRNYRKKIGEFERRCSRQLGAVMRISHDPSELRADMERLGELHRKRWRTHSGAVRTREYLAFHHAVAQRFLERGWVRLFALEARGRPVAYLYCFVYNGRYYYYQAGRDPDYERYRVGLVLIHRAIRQAIREGADTFDFLTGQETYKYRWAESELRNVRLAAWTSWAPAAVARLRVLFAPARRQARKLLPLSGSLLGLVGALAVATRRREDPGDP